MLKSEYAANYKKKTKPYPGITKLLDYLEAHQIPYSICTNKPDVAAKSLVHALFPDYHFVDVIGFTRDDLRKPNPTTTLKLAEKMGVKAKDCLYVGDSTIDYETALRAGMLPVLCTWGFESFGSATAGGCDSGSIIRCGIVEALRYGKEMYSLFNETPKPGSECAKENTD